MLMSAMRLNRKHITFGLGIFMAIVNLSACRGDEMVIPVETERIAIDGTADPSVEGVYLLNEGNMGSNKCTLDFLDLASGTYSRNIFPERNPNVAKELGDVGNDIAIYGSKLYIVVNCSHKVEVLDAKSGIRITHIDIPNCRHIKFNDGKAYISSYVGPVEIGNSSPKGAIYQVDTLSLTVDNRVTVGYQPEEIEIIDGLLYVANSGGYRPPDYDNTLSVVRLSDFRQIQKIEVGKNPGRVRKDKYNRLWVSCRGDNTENQGCLLLLSPDKTSGKMKIEKRFDISVNNLALHDNLLYYFSATGSSGASYGVIDIDRLVKMADGFITDGSEKSISVPYGINIFPQSGNILLTDAKNYVSSGTLYCFSPEGKQLWSVRTGDIPAHIAILKK